MVRSRGRGRLAFVRNSSHGCHATKQLRPRLLMHGPETPNIQEDQLVTTHEPHFAVCKARTCRSFEAHQPRSPRNSWSPSLLKRIANVFVAELLRTSRHRALLQYPENFLVPKSLAVAKKTCTLSKELLLSTPSPVGTVLRTPPG